MSPTTMTSTSEREIEATAKAYCENKDIFLRSLGGLPHLEIVDAILALGNSTTRLSYCLQDNADVEIWQVAQDPTNEEYTDQELMAQLKEVVADIKIKAPNVLHVELDVNPWFNPPQKKLMETLRVNGYKLCPGHDSLIMVGEISHLCESLSPAVNNAPRQLTVQRMSEPQHGRDFSVVVNTAFHLPPIWCQQSVDRLVINATRDRDSHRFFYFVGYLDSNGDPAVCLTLCLTAGVVGIHWAATHPKYQKQGLFQELVYTVMKELLPKYSAEYTYYTASARSTSAAFFQKHGAVPVATKYKYVLYSKE
jgi:GNAT superfamily N-acetyltransferase